MKTPSRILFYISVLVLLTATHVYAQQPVASISQLKEQIKSLEIIDRDSSTPSDVKNVNRGFLKERRNQLHSLLKIRIEALRRYQETVKATLTSNESQIVESSIRDLQMDLQDLEDGMQNEMSPVLLARTSSDASMSLTPTSILTTDSIPLETMLAKAPSAKREKASSVIPLVPAQVSPATNTYKDAPPLLVNVVDRVTDDIIQADAAAPPPIPATYPAMLFYAVADAVTPAETAAQARSIRTLDAYQYLGETARTDKQVGAPAKAAGTTSAIEKPGFARLLGLAVEKGAIIQDVNSSSLTLSTSPYVLYTLDGGDTAENYQRASFLNRIGLSANFNIEDQNNVLGSARRSQLNQWSVRARLFGDRSTRSKEFQDFWNENIRGPIEGRLNAVTGALVFFNNARFDPLTATENGLVTQINSFTSSSGYAGMSKAEKKEKLTNIILSYLKGEVVNKIQDGTFTVNAVDRKDINDKLVRGLAVALQNINGIRKLLNDQLDDVQKGPQATMSYVNHRQAMGSDYSEGMFLFEQDMSAFRSLKLVANLGASFYHKPNRTMNQQTARDFSAALSFEKRIERPWLADSPDLSKITIAFTGNYQRMFENKRVAGRKADIASAQFKVDLPIFAGLSLPFSVSYSNSTEQSKKERVRVNFGFNFDMDKLFAVTRVSK